MVGDWGVGEVNVAADGVEGVDAIEGSLKDGDSYDLILLDILMPKMSGQEVLRKIRELKEEYLERGAKHPKVIMTTVCDARSTIAEAFQGECDGYLIKPVTVEMIVNEIERLGLKSGL